MEDDSVNAGAVKLQSKRQARQYMNRKVRYMLGRCCLLWQYIACIKSCLAVSSNYRTHVSFMLMIRSIKWWVIYPMQGGFNRPLAVERTGEKALRN